VAPRSLGARLAVELGREGTRRNLGLLVALLLTVVVISILSPAYLSLENFQVIVLQMAFIGIGALGTAMLIISGNVDLSIGSIFATSAVLAAMLAKEIPPPLALLVGILVGGILGLVNGVLVLRVQISPIIITLATMTILRGVILLVSHGVGVTGVPESFSNFAEATPVGIPMPVIVLVLAALATYAVLSRTTLGRYIYAVGGNREASVAAGINVWRLILGAFAVNGLIVGLAAILAASRFGTANPNYGVGYELNVITVVILGGVAFTGGEGGIGGVIIATVLLGVIQSGLVAVGVDPFYQEIAKGGALIVAVIIDQLTSEQRERHRTALAMRERVALAAAQRQEV
jgi:ribose transport system permease protein